MNGHSNSAVIKITVGLSSLILKSHKIGEKNELQISSTQIIELEDSIVQLKEDLVHEREEAQLEKEKLTQSVVRICQDHVSCILGCMIYFVSHGDYMTCIKFMAIP